MVSVSGDIWMAAATGLLPPEIEKGSVQDLLNQYQKKMIEVFNETFDEIGEKYTYQKIKVNYGLFRSVRLSCHFDSVGMEWTTTELYGTYYKDIHELFSYHHDNKGLEIICQHGDKLLKNLPKAIKKHHKNKIKEKRKREENKKRRKELCKTNLRKWID